jgi:hypothetical protein
VTLTSAIETMKKFGGQCDERQFSKQVLVTAGARHRPGDRNRFLIANARLVRYRREKASYRAEQPRQ